MCDFQMTGFQRITRDVAIAYDCAHVVECAERLPENASRGVAAVALERGAEAEPPYGRSREAAIATAASPAGSLCFEHGSSYAIASRELVRARKARVPAADDCDFDLCVAVQRAIVGRWVAGCCRPKRRHVREPKSRRCR